MTPQPGEALREAVYSILHDETCGDGAPHVWSEHLPWDDPDDEAASKRVADRLIAALSNAAPVVGEGLREALAEHLFAEFGWPTRAGAGRVDRNRHLTWGDGDNPAWLAAADRILALAANQPVAEERTP